MLNPISSIERVGCVVVCARCERASIANSNKVFCFCRRNRVRAISACNALASERIKGFAPRAPFHPLEGVSSARSAAWSARSAAAQGHIANRIARPIGFTFRDSTIITARPACVPQINCQLLVRPLFIISLYWPS